MEEDIKNRIIKNFCSKRLSAMHLVEQFEAEEGLSARVTRCIIHLAKGDIGKLEASIQSAKLDWHDVILWAESIPLEFSHPFANPANMSRTNFDILKEFIVELIGVDGKEVTPYARLYEDLGVYGDDATEMLLAYSRKFNVDVSKFMASDYFKSEGMDLIGGLWRFITGKRLRNYKVLTINDLEKGINAGRLDEEVIAGTSKSRNWQYDENDFQRTYALETVPTQSEWLLLRIVDQQPDWANDYRLERFMAKTDLFAAFYDVLYVLVKKGWLQTKDPNAQVREYFTTSKGKKLLTEGYKTKDIKDFVMMIEPTGYIVEILEKIDARSLNAPQ